MASSKNNETSRSLNPNFKRLLAQKKKTHLSLQGYMDGILDGDSVVLGQAITIIESEREADQELAGQIIEKCLSITNHAIRIGITGAPGVGKSTFIEALGEHLLKQQKKIAILAIDPSSQMSGGSILGDKTRMESLSSNANVFIRPSPSGSSLGGVARKTRETIIACEAAGYDVILIETVGVGQAEFVIHSMVDCFLLLILPGAGDELQGIKRGIMEMADLVLINKADGDNIKLAKQTKKDYQNALHLLPLKESDWQQKVMVCSALQKKEIAKAWQQIQAFFSFIKTNNFLSQNRAKQVKYWLEEATKQGLLDLFFKNEQIQKEWEKIEKSVLENRLSPFQGAHELINFFKQLPTNNK